MSQKRSEEWDLKEGEEGEEGDLKEEEWKT